MKNTYWLALCCLLLAACKSQQPSASNNNTPSTLFTIAGEPVSEQEFLYVYNKNNISRDTAQPSEDLRQYLDLYINFKLKVREAREKGLHQQAAFQEELDSYKKQLARPYLTESSVTEQLVEEAYKRLATEINASHILIAVNPGAAPADTLAAYQKAQELRQKAQAGADFGDLARRFSDDPSAQSNRGNLGYFTALQMVYPFENAAYSTPVGAISAPVRTRFGYHVLKVHDKRPSQGKIKVAHLMVRTQPEMTADEQAAAKARIQALYQQLQQGESWEALVRQFSEDKSTAPKGGELQPFSTGQMIPEFEKVAFTLKEAGSIAPPVQTPYGWHIIKLLEREGLPPLEEIRAELEARVSRDSRSQLQEEALISRLKKENGFIENQAALQALLQQADSSLLEGSWTYQPDTAAAGQLLFSLTDSTYTTADFVAWLNEHPYNRQAAEPGMLLNRLYQEWQKEALIAYEEAHLEEKYEDYRMLVQEYHDGILLFQLMEENVWAKALEDTTGLQQFFAQNQQNYQWKERIEGLVLNAANNDVLQQAEAMLAKAPYVLGSKTLAQPVAENGALTAQSRRELGLLMASMLHRQDQVLQVEAPKELHGLLRTHLQEAGFAANRYELKPAAGQTATLSLLSSSPAALEQHFNARKPLNLQVIMGPFERGDHPVVDAISWQPGRYRLAQDGRQYLVVVQEVLPPGPKTLDQVRGQAISDYQQHLEQEWVARLRTTYEVRVNKKEFESLLEREKIEQTN